MSTLGAYSRKQFFPDTANKLKPPPQNSMTIEVVRQRVSTVESIYSHAQRYCMQMTDLCAGLSNFGDTILETFFVKAKLFTLASKEVLVQAD